MIKNFFGSRHVRLDGSESQLWSQAAQNAPIYYRLFRRSVSISDLDTQLSGLADWYRLKPQLMPNDLIWPFAFNQGTSAMRQGYVVIRSGKPVTGIVSMLS